MKRLLILTIGLFISSVQLQALKTELWLNFKKAYKTYQQHKTPKNAEQLADVALRNLLRAPTHIKYGSLFGMRTIIENEEAAPIWQKTAHELIDMLNPEQDPNLKIWFVGTGKTRQLIQTLSATEQQAFNLVKQLLNDKNNTLSWQCFAHSIKDIFQQDPEQKYKTLIPVFAQLSTSTDMVTIGTKLNQYKHELPEAIETFLNQKMKNTTALAAQISKSIKLNDENLPCLSSKLTKQHKPEPQEEPPGLKKSPDTTTPPETTEPSAVKKATEDLIEQLLNNENNTLSWKCFTQIMQKIVAIEQKYAHLVPVFEQLSTLTDFKKIQTELAKLMVEMGEDALSSPEEAEVLLAFFTNQIQKSIALNKKNLPCVYIITT